MKKEEIYNQEWHHLSEESVIKLLESNLEDGILVKQAKKRLALFGYNQLIAQKSKGPIVRFFLQFHQPLVYILLVSGIVTAFLRQWVESAAIVSVTIVNAIVGFLQETKALKALEILARGMQVKTRVVREGKTYEIAANQLVPGDIVLLRSGDKVPADLRLLRVHGLRIDESILTGESLPIDKQAGDLSVSAILAERNNMAYANTLVIHGQAKGIVVATGKRMEIGRISELISEGELLETPLTRKIKQFSNRLLWGILIFSAATFAIGLWQGRGVTEIFLITVALAVSLIPEGLPAAFTIILAIGVSRMAKKNAIIRKLPAVETLGSTTVICADKTGTLTENKVTVQSIFSGGNYYKITTTGYVPEGEILDANDEKADLNIPLKECLLAGLLCNDSLLVNEGGIWDIEGDPTEGALIVSARKAGLTEEHYSEKFARIGVGIPFESEHQFMATLHNMGKDKKKKIYLKGSAETLLSRCSKILMEEGQAVALDPKAIMEEVNNMAERGMRVLAFAKRELDFEGDEIGHQDVASDFVFLGLQAMIDPAREDAIKAIENCYLASIEVKMITGDHETTAAAIAQKLKIKEIQGHPALITGKELLEAHPDEMGDLVNDNSIFARVTPEQKLDIVRALQSKGNIVAMTGDGVNDAPAIKQADIGIAIGEGGSEIAKEVADMVLLDNNFATIAKAVEEGRCVFDNLVKFIIWTLPTCCGAGLIIFISIIIGGVSPLITEQILWINMATSLMLGLTLAFEPKERDVMMRAPRDPKSPIITKALAIRIFSVSLLMLAAAYILFHWHLNTEADLKVARTVVTNLLVIVQAFYLLNCRSLEKSVFSVGLFSNKWMLLGIGCMIIAQLIFTYVPIFNRLFKTAPISLNSWILIVLFSFLVCLAIGVEKWISNRFILKKR